MAQQIALTPAQRTQLLTELEGAGPEYDPLRAAIAAGEPEITPALVALLGEAAASPHLSPTDRAAWEALRQEAASRVE